MNNQVSFIQEHKAAHMNKMLAMYGNASKLVTNESASSEKTATTGNEAGGSNDGSASTEGANTSNEVTTTTTEGAEGQ